MKKITKDVIEIHAQLLDKYKDSHEIEDLQGKRSSLLTKFRGSFFKLFYMTGVNPQNAQDIEDYPYLLRGERKINLDNIEFIKILSITSQPMVNPIKRKIGKRVRKGA